MPAFSNVSNTVPVPLDYRQIKAVGNPQADIGILFDEHRLMSVLQQRLGQIKSDFSAADYNHFHSSNSIFQV